FASSGETRGRRARSRIVCRSVVLITGEERKLANCGSWSSASSSSASSCRTASAPPFSFARSSSDAAYARAAAECRVMVAIADLVLGDGLELFEALPDQLALVVGVEVAPQDLLGDAGGDRRGLLVDFRQRLVLGGLDLLAGAFLGFLGLLLRLHADAGGDALGVGLGLAEQLAHLAFGLGELSLVFLKRGLGAGAGGLSVGDVAADLVFAGLEARGDRTPGELAQDRDQQQ